MITNSQIPPAQLPWTTSMDDIYSDTLEYEQHVRNFPQALMCTKNIVSWARYLIRRHQYLHGRRNRNHHVRLRESIGPILQPQAGASIFTFPYEWGGKSTEPFFLGHFAWRHHLTPFPTFFQSKYTLPRPVGVIILVKSNCWYFIYDLIAYAVKEISSILTQIPMMIRRTV